MKDRKVDPKKIRPLGNRVLVQLDEPEKETKGGIVLPDNAQEVHKIGLVIAVGPGKPIEPNTVEDMPLSNKTRTIRVGVGCRVFFDPPYSAKFPGADDLFLIEDDAILCVIED